MKKSFFYVAALFLGLSFVGTSCSSDDNGDYNWEYDGDDANLDCTPERVNSWANYMRATAILLQDDATNLYNYWNDSYDGGASYATIFTQHNTSVYSSAISCIEQIIDGCVDIASEVGAQKIGDPVSKWNANDREGALYAVESWYSWHSRDDYRNNIYSIRNAYYGSRNGVVASNSISALISQHDAALDTKVKNAISAAADAIWNIPDPFRNNIASEKSEAAMDACAALETVLDNELKVYILNNLASNSQLDAIISTYVQDVVLPTYRDLKAAVDALYSATVTFGNNPSDANFSACADAWLAAREPWETSEAFLFGPVADKGLDPNMDSWPLDQDAIVQVLRSGRYDQMQWAGDFEDAEESDTQHAQDIASAQSKRGFHTLEFLVFKDGLARKIVTAAE